MIQMALTLKYRNGFIDAEAEMPQPLQSDLPRASSLPPKMSKMVQVEEFLQEEEPSFCAWDDQEWSRSHVLF